MKEREHHDHPSQTEYEQPQPELDPVLVLNPRWKQILLHALKLPGHQTKDNMDTEIKPVLLASSEYLQQCISIVLMSIGKNKEYCLG